MPEEYERDLLDVEYEWWDDECELWLRLELRCELLWDELRCDELL